MVLCISVTAELSALCFSANSEILSSTLLLKASTDVLISVTDILGNETSISQLFDASAGEYKEIIDLTEFAKGYYLIKLKINGEVQAQKIQKL